jgi:hypothetical protein
LNACVVSHLTARGAAQVRLLLDVCARAGRACDGRGAPLNGRSVPWHALAWQTRAVDASAGAQRPPPRPREGASTIGVAVGEAAGRGLARPPRRARPRHVTPRAPAALQLRPRAPLPPPSRTNWTRLAPPSVLTGHVSSLRQRYCYDSDLGSLFLVRAHPALPLHARAMRQHGEEAPLSHGARIPPPARLCSLFAELCLGAGAACGGVRLLQARAGRLTAHGGKPPPRALSLSEGHPTRGSTPHTMSEDVTYVT